MKIEDNKKESIYFEIFFLRDMRDDNPNRACREVFFSTPAFHKRNLIIIKKKQQQKTCELIGEYENHLFPAVAVAVRIQAIKMNQYNK